MMNVQRNLIKMMAVVITTPFAMAQPSDIDSRCTDGSCPLNGYSQQDSTHRRDRRRSNRIPVASRDLDWRLNDVYPASGRRTSGYGDRAYNHRDRFLGVYEDQRDRMRYGYDYKAPLDSAVRDSFRKPLSCGYSNDGRDADRRYPNGLADPFQLPGSSSYRNRDYLRQTPLTRDYRDRGYNDYESRYRIPLDRVDYTNHDRDYRPLNRDDVINYVPLRGRTDGQSGSRDRYDDRTGQDPFTPPLPRRDAGSESEAIMKAISARYGNPVNVRAARSMSESQALALFREVSQQTDQRHLEPSSYDLRIRRGLRNLSMALDNPTFAQSLGVDRDSFRLDGFRSSLARIGDRMRVASYTDAQQVVQQVMQETRSVPGLNANVVAFEFANATVDTLDKFSALEPKEPGRGASLDLTRMKESRHAGLESEMVGIGVEIKSHNDGLLIMKSLRGGPAVEAGVKSGDVITSINGRSIRGMSMANSVDLMKGNSGSRIQLGISRDGSRARNVNLVRRSIRLYTVNEAKMLRGTQKVAYVSLSQFGPKSTEELDQALSQLHKNGMESLILDMRGNPGGLLNVCVDITNRFLPCGTIVSTKGRLSSDNMLETASFNRTWSMPLVVLIDGESASASEIFAAAVQDNQRGIVVGERSYGKGTVQTHFPLSSVGGNLRLTTARFYSPNGKAMSGKGVTPSVRISDADGPANGDRVLDEAIVIAQSQRLRDIAKAARKCRPSSGGSPQRNSFKGGDIMDTVTPKTVLR